MTVQRSLGLAAVVMAAGFVFTAWTMQFRLDRYRAECRLIAEEFERLSQHCPPDADLGRWKQAIDETANIVAQSSGPEVFRWSGPPTRSTYDELHALHLDLKAKLSHAEFQGKEDVLWIYDRVRATSPYADKCGTRFRPLFEIYLNLAFEPVLQEVK